MRESLMVVPSHGGLDHWGTLPVTAWSRYPTRERTVDDFVNNIATTSQVPSRVQAERVSIESAHNRQLRTAQSMAASGMIR
jgi:hypothetical protein